MSAPNKVHKYYSTMYLCLANVKICKWRFLYYEKIHKRTYSDELLRYIYAGLSEIESTLYIILESLESEVSGAKAILKNNGEEGLLSNIENIIPALHLVGNNIYDLVHECEMSDRLEM